MNETGATVILRGRGSGNDEGSNGEGTFFICGIQTFEGNYISVQITFVIFAFQFDLFSVLDGQQPMHLFLSSNNAKSLEDAKFLAENLLDTISMECGASRYSILYCHMIQDVSQVFFLRVENLGNTLFFSNISSYHIETNLYLENTNFYYLIFHGTRQPTF